MNETILLYNPGDTSSLNHLRNFCRQTGITLKIVPEEDYALPIGMAAFGTPEAIRNFKNGTAPQPVNTVDDPILTMKKRVTKASHSKTFHDPMMVLAGLTSNRLNLILTKLKEDGMPDVDLKCVLTQYNAVGDSASLHDEISKEHAALQQKK